MNLGTSSQPRQQRLLDTPPYSPTQASQSVSSLARKAKSKAKGRKPRPKKIDVTHTRWTQEEEKLLAETFLQISEDLQLGIDQSHKTFWGKVTSEYNHHATVQRTKDMITGKWTTLTRDCNKFVAIVDENARLSGENDSTWQARCYKTFVQLWGSPFVHYDAWDV
ncbi:hypothetical protein Tco_0969872 [Tanacetum coccineum]